MDFKTTKAACMICHKAMTLTIITLNIQMTEMSTVYSVQNSILDSKISPTMPIFTKYLEAIFEFFKCKKTR